MANGFRLLRRGSQEVMQVGAIDQPGMERTFLLSSTHAEMPGLAAFIETARIYQDEAVTDHLWDYGKRLRSGLFDLASRHGIAQHFLIDGPAISLNYLTLDTEQKPSMALRTLFAQEMVKHGVLMPWIAISQSHGDSGWNSP